MPLPPLPEPKSRLRRLTAAIGGIAIMTPILIILLAANGLQMLSMILIPFSPRLFRKFNREMANSFWGMCSRAYDVIYRGDIRIGGDPVPMKENAILVLNHQEMSDITVLFKVGAVKGRLGDMKYFVKDSIKYVPGVGWGMQFLDCLFISRNWTDDAAKIQRVFGRIIKNKVDAWIISFVEGTRLRPRKLEAAQAFSRKRGLPVLQHLLFPRTKGFVATVNALRGHADAVYDITIGYTDGVPTLWQYIKGYVREVDVHINRFPLASLPEDEAELTNWLIARWEAKDKLLEGFYRKGTFEEPAA